MTASRKTKLKLLYVQKMLMEETDSEHGLSMRDIIERLEEYGVTAERKGVYRDIEVLRMMGMDIKTYQRNPVEYGIDERSFKLEELMLVADAIASCKFLTKRQSASLIQQVKQLASEHQRSQLDKRINVYGRISTKKESIFDDLHTIYQAITEKRKVSFLYVRLDEHGDEVVQHDGEPYVLTPVKIVFDNNFYYLRAWNDHYDDAANYRLDRMRAVHITDEPATSHEGIATVRQEEDGSEFFGTFDGERTHVTLSVERDRVEILYDRFGRGGFDFSEATDPGRLNAHVVVRKSPAFFGWLAGLDSVVKLEGPASIVSEYRDYLQNLITQLG